MWCLRGKRGLAPDVSFVCCYDGEANVMDNVWNLQRKLAKADTVFQFKSKDRGRIRSEVPAVSSESWVQSLVPGPTELA